MIYCVKAVVPTSTVKKQAVLGQILTPPVRNVTAFPAVSIIWKIL